MPLLVFGAGLSTAKAGPVGLVAVGLSAAFVAVQALRAGQLRYRAAAVMAACGALFAPLGLSLAQRVDERMLMLLFSAVLGHVGLRALRQPATGPVPAAPPCVLDPATGRLRWTSRCGRALLASGALAGFFSGLLGVGGGFLLVPALRRYSDLPMRSVIATSLGVIALVSGATVVSTIAGSGLDATIALPFAAGALIAAGAGRSLGLVLRPRVQQQCFAALALGVALAMLVKAAL